MNDMAQMVSYVACMILGSYHKTGNWPQAEDRALFVDRWLERQGHVSSFWKLSMLAHVADNVARTVIYDAPDIMDLVADDQVSREEILAELLEICRGALFKNGLAE